MCIGGAARSPHDLVGALCQTPHSVAISVALYIRTVSLLHIIILCKGTAFLWNTQ